MVLLVGPSDVRHLLPAGYIHPRLDLLPGLDLLPKPKLTGPPHSDTGR